MEHRRRHRRYPTIAQGTYQGACLVHARAQLASFDQQQNTTLIRSHACSRGDDTRDTLQPYKTCTKTRASSMPVHDRCNEIKNRSFIGIDACSRGDDTEACASSMPVHNWRHVINNKTLNLSAVMRAVEATTQETHCSRTRHVPRRVPRPCPCTIGVMKSRTDHLLALTHVAEATT